MRAQMHWNVRIVDAPVIGVLLSQFDRSESKEEG
jgi:hypothetical protein